MTGDSNTTRIGFTGAQQRAFIAGINGVVLGSGVPVYIDPNGQLGTGIPSSRRFKQDIHAMGSASDPLMKLRPVTFRYRSAPSNLQYGLVAEQVAKVMPTLAVYGQNGRPLTVDFQNLPVLLLNQVQRRQRQIRALEARNDRLKRQQQRDRLADEQGASPLRAKRWGAGGPEWASPAFQSKADGRFSSKAVVR